MAMHNWWWDKLRDELKRAGVDIDVEVDAKEGHESKVKVVCVAPNLKSCVEEMGQQSREHVVMVRVDEVTLRKLDAWVETGAVKSRSEAAALFIREGLKVRGAELEELEDALDGLNKAKQRLREKAREVFGDEETESVD